MMHNYSYLFIRFYKHYTVKLLKYKTFQDNRYIRWISVILTHSLFIWGFTHFSRNVFWSNTLWTMQHWVFIFSCIHNISLSDDFDGYFILLHLHVVDQYFFPLSRRTKYWEFPIFQIRFYWWCRYAVICELLEWHYYRFLI